MKTNRSLHGNDGFTLVELLVAIGILSIVGTVLFNGFVLAARTYLKTSKLQMAEDVAQEVAEVFRATPLDGSNGLLALYAEKEPDPADPGSGKMVVKSGVDTTDSTSGVRTILFNDIANFDYNSRVNAVSGFGDYTVDVTLKSINTAKNSEIGKVLDDPSTHDATDPRKTTYEQSAYGKDGAVVRTDGIYIINENVGTNSFVVPEVKNIYDGTSVILSEDINQYDINVAEDMLNVICKAVAAENVGKTALAQVDAHNVESTFCARYIPYTGITSSIDIQKETEFDFQQKLVSGGVKYYCLVSIKYTFNFDMPLLKANGMPYGKNLSTIMAGMNGHEDGAVTKYTISVTGSEYTISYLHEIPTTAGAEGYYEGLGGLKASFVQEIKVSNKDGSEQTYKADGTGDKVPDFYILYTPFDIYSSSTADANDVIKIKNEIPVDAKNVLRTFFVVQDTTHTKAMSAGKSLTTKVKNCSFTLGQPTPTKAKPLTKFNFQFYTNSSDIISNSTNNITAECYMTNSTSKTHTNLYEMEIIVYDNEGNKVATVNTVKEE